MCFWLLLLVLLPLFWLQTWHKFKICSWSWCSRTRALQKVLAIVTMAVSQHPVERGINEHGNIRRL